jgi:hypothetical protein
VVERADRGDKQSVTTDRSFLICWSCSALSGFRLAANTRVLGSVDHWRTWEKGEEKQQSEIEMVKVMMEWH